MDCKMDSDWIEAIREIDKNCRDNAPIFDPNVIRHDMAINLLMWSVRKLMDRVNELEDKR